MTTGSVRSAQRLSRGGWYSWFLAGALTLLSVLAYPLTAHAATTASAPSTAVASASKVGKVLLVDDDESDNNNYPGDKRLSVSDTFYRSLLKAQGLAFDTFSVPRYKNGPDFTALRGYSLVVWYTGASYGGNPDNTAVISLDDEKTIQHYLTETGGTLILVSPGYMSNALGANVESHWSNMTSDFLTTVIGVKGGRGLLRRFEAGQVTNAAGTSFTVTKNPSVETQFSALNPDTATTVFTASLDPDGKGARPIAVAISHVVGSGHLVYVAFTLENVAPDASVAFGSLLQSAGGPPALQAPAAPPGATPLPARLGSAHGLTITGTTPPPARLGSAHGLTITGTTPPPARLGSAHGLTITGTTPPPARLGSAHGLTITGTVAAP